jgi:hypothetical protein
VVGTEVVEVSNVVEIVGVLVSSVVVAPVVVVPIVLVVAAEVLVSCVEVPVG